MAMYNWSPCTLMIVDMIPRPWLVGVEHEEGGRRTILLQHLPNQTKISGIEFFVKIASRNFVLTIKMLMEHEIS